MLGAVERQVSGQRGRGRCRRSMFDVVLEMMIMDKHGATRGDNELEGDDYSSLQPGSSIEEIRRSMMNSLIKDRKMYCSPPLHSEIRSTVH
jgi:hypothetical protein